MGGDHSGEKLQKEQYDQSNATTQKLLTQQQQRYDRADAFNAPLADFAKSILKGDQTSLHSALAPQVSTITHNNAAARENIFNTVGPGAGRDVALANLERDKSGQVSNLQNSTFLNAYQTLSNIAGQQYGVAGTQLGASLNSEGESIGAANNVAKTQAENKQATMGFLGSLAGGAGSALQGSKFLA